MKIEGLPTSIAPAAGGAANTPVAETSAGFSQALDSLIGSVNASDAAADTAVTNMVNGSGDVHEAMIALQQADLALQLTIQVRNKLVQAYQEISRMPI
ncbi:MAG TPA: flagellar hook-basal body complex protein FliE [Vicinamibacterales bacterium]|nr:flagellar hook-basal body complex protein FliE [Vicinamibacterales bacterium]